VKLLLAQVDRFFIISFDSISRRFARVACRSLGSMLDWFLSPSSLLGRRLGEYLGLPPVLLESLRVPAALEAGCHFRVYLLAKKASNLAICESMVLLTIARMCGAKSSLFLLPRPGRLAALSPKMRRALVTSTQRWKPTSASRFWCLVARLSRQAKKVQPEVCTSVAEDVLRQDWSPTPASQNCVLDEHQCLDQQSPG
jgi:hypothetical protein